MRRLLPVVVLLALGLAAAAFGQAVGPSQRITGNGRLLAPAGRLTKLGNFPTGGTLSPDGRFLWAVDSGHGADDVQIVDVGSGQVVQTLPLPGGYGAAAFSPDGRRAYVSGEPKSGDKLPQGPTKGDSGDVVHVYDVDPAGGHATERDPIALPAVSGGSGQQNSLPPVSKDWPEGLAVTPDGRRVVVALNQADRVAVIDVASGKVTTIPVGRYPFGVAIDPSGTVAYVTNEYDGTVSVVDLAAGKQVQAIGVGGARGDLNAHPEGMVLDAAAHRLYVAVANRDLVATIDTRSRTVVGSVSVARAPALGTQPVGLALTPDGSVLFAADEGEDAVAAIATGVAPRSGATAAGQVRTPHRVVRVHTARWIAAHRRRRASKLRGRTVVACLGPSRAQEARYLRSVLAAARRRARDHSRRRFARSVAAARRRLPQVSACPRVAPAPLASLAAAGGPRLLGRLPTAAFPMDVKVTPDGRRLIWIAAKGFGSGANPGYVFDVVKPTKSSPPNQYGTYVLDKLDGYAGTLDVPTATALARMSADAERQVVPSNATAPPPGTPLRPDGPIKHVFYVVKENRTYDQLFGTDPRGDGDPKLELFDDNGVKGPTGGVTPNAHALTRRFPLLDNFYADSEVSVDGHLITAGAIAIDYAQRATAANYSRPGRAFDFGIFPVTFGPNDFVFDQAARQDVSFRVYGEEGGGNSPFGNDGRPTFKQVAANTDNAYPGNIQIGCLQSSGQPPGSPATCSRDSGVTAGAPAGAIGGLSRIDTFAQQFRAQDAAGTVPRFNYLILPNDHTNGTTPGTPTPKAFIADNDLALGQLVDLVSHSSIWSSSAIIVVEDDSQDGADHVDAHRMPAYVISPWARTDGAAVHTRYDQYSALRTAEILAGLDPLSVNDGLATPMYDVFRTDGRPDLAPYDAIVPQQPLTETNSSSSALAAMSAKLPWDDMDLVPQAVSDRILWASVFGARSAPPGPGPDASPVEHARALTALRLLRDGGDVRGYLRRTASADDG